MNPIEQLIDTNEFPLDLFQVYDAMRFVEAAHLGRKRWDGTDEFEHLLSVASRCIKHGFNDTHSVIVGLLHDVVEDTAVSHVAVHDVFGPDVAHDVMLLTQERGESRHDYLSRVLGPDSNETVIGIKFCDRADNVAGLHTCPSLPSHADHVENYFSELRDYFAPVADLVPESLADELMGLTARAAEYFNKGEIIQFGSRPRLTRVK